MKVTLALYQKIQVEELLKRADELSPLQKEVTLVLGFKEVSRFFNFTKEECLDFARELKKRDYTVMLQWDILMTEEVFGSVFYGLKAQGLFDHSHSGSEIFDGLRVQDPGLLYALKEIDYQGELHFIAENGNHNLRGLKSWHRVWPQKIKRIVVSPQLPAKTIREYAEVLGEELNLELEVLGLGPILLFYTPRKLVSPLYGGENDNYFVQGTSEESPHKGFPIIENAHGTFMLNTKDQFIFDELASTQRELAKVAHLHWRLDPICGLGKQNFVELLLLLANGSSTFDEVKEAYGRSVTKGFFRVNKTDVLFKKLKNHRLQERDDSFVGEVVDVKKKKHIGVWIKSKSGLKTGDTLKLLSPEGREKVVIIERMTNGESTPISKATKGQIAFIPPVGGISVKTMVYLS